MYYLLNGFEGTFTKERNNATLSALKWTGYPFAWRNFGPAPEI